MSSLIPVLFTKDGNLESDSFPYDHPHSNNMVFPKDKKCGVNLSKSSNDQIVQLIVASLNALKPPLNLTSILFKPGIGRLLVPV